MKDTLLSYFERELDFLEKSAVEFAKAYPEAGRHLLIGQGGVEDPHVRRLLGGVAFLNARIRMKLDDEFPELPGAMLEQLYPHYTAPTPSMAIVKFEPVSDYHRCEHIPRGFEVLTETVGRSGAVRFQTTMGVDVWPLEIRMAKMGALPLAGPLTPAGARSSLHLQLACLGKAQAFGALDIDHLRFFLPGPSQEVADLQERLLNDVLAVAATFGPADEAPLVLPAAAVRPVGFADAERLLPRSPGSEPGFHLLSELFSFPSKFSFFDIGGLSAKLRNSNERLLNIYFYFSQPISDTLRSIEGTSFALGCTPVVNLFSEPAAPLRLDGRRRHDIVAPIATPEARELWSIDQVRLKTWGGSVRRLPSLYGLEDRSGGTGLCWRASRRPRIDPGAPSEVLISFIDRGEAESLALGDLAHIDALWTNADLPSRLPYGIDRPRMSLTEPRTGVSRVRLVTRPTPRRPPIGREESLWRLISHLRLNHLALASADGSPEPIREILSLYDPTSDAETSAQINNILRVSARPALARVPGPLLGLLARGLDVEITFASRVAGGVSAFLVASVLDRFFAGYVPINSFSRVTAWLEHRTGELARWPARSRDQILS